MQVRWGIKDLGRIPAEFKPFEAAPNEFDPASITTEEMLADFLAKLGFVSRPIKENDVRIGRGGKFIGQPQRYLFRQDNPGFESHAAVSIDEGSTICVYYYQMENELFGIWEKFSGRVEVEAIKKAIRSAVTMKDILIRFYPFWPERVQTEEALDSLLASLGFKSHETSWPNSLPSAGESPNAIHRLILAREHNLDNDALVSVEKTTVYVYYRDRVSGAFGEWAKLSGEKNYAAISKWAKSFSEEDQNKIISSLIPEVKYSVFYDAIISAMTGKKEKEGFEG